MLENTHVKIVTQKFSEKGHPLVQEVDNAHSCIEKTLERDEVFSPISLIRALKTVRRNPQIHILQMRSADFFNFEKLSKTMNFLKIPFFSVKQLKYHSNLPHFVTYKECHSNTKPDLCVSILKKGRTLRVGKNTHLQEIVPISSVSLLKAPVRLSKEKANDIKSMLCFMPAIDCTFYETILK